MSANEELGALLSDAKRLARHYYRLTGRPLGITGEVAEYEAIRLLNLEAAPVRQSGFDAQSANQDGKRERYQIKGRCIIGPAKAGARVGSIDLAKEWDSVLLVLLDEAFEVTAIYRAERAIIQEALLRPGSKARTERGQLALSQFKRLGTKVWPTA